MLQPCRHQHEDRVAVREDPDDPRPPPDFAVDALDPVVRPDLVPVLGREFRVGKRLGEPVAYRPRGRSAELRHAEIDFPDARDEFSRVAAAVVAIPARRPLVALGPPTSSDASFSSSALSASSTVFLIRFYMSLRSNSSLTDTIFTDSARALSSMICCLAAGNHMTGCGPCSAMRLSICERNYAAPPFDEKLINDGSAARAWG